MSAPQTTAGRPDLHVVDVTALQPCTALSAARQIAEHARCSRAEAERMVGAYLDEVSEQVGCSVHRWGLDPHDLAAILTDNGHTVTGERTDRLEQARSAVDGADQAVEDSEAARQEPSASHDEDSTSDAADAGWGS